MKLPEMSVIDTHLPSNTKIRGYTVEQMLAWGKACAAAEREEIAKLADASVNAKKYPTLTMLAQAIRMRGD
jgi:hypothetical protein